MDLKDVKAAFNAGVDMGVDLGVQGVEPEAAARAAVATIRQMTGGRIDPVWLRNVADHSRRYAAEIDLIASEYERGEAPVDAEG